MKNEFSFLFPYPRHVLVRDDFLDIRDLCFPLEIYKKYDFLFEFFNVRNKNRGLEILFQENQELGAEEFMLASGRKQILVQAHSSSGQFYSLATLLQILSFYSRSGRMPGFSIRDGPQIAIRGFAFAAAGGAVPAAAELQRLLLKMALLRFNYFALPALGSAGPEKPVAGSSLNGVFNRDEMDSVSDRARKMGLELFFLPADEESAPGQGPDRDDGAFDPAGLAETGSEAGKRETAPAAWFEDFLRRCRLGKARGEKTLAWADCFADRGDWIRKIPHDVVVLQRDPQTGKSDFFKNKALPFKKHHVPQVLCQIIQDKDRFIPANRSSMAGIRAAFHAAKAEKLAGVMLIDGESGGSGCLPEGSALLHFEAGCLLWSGRPPAPGSFSRWALGRDEPDLFRIYTFLAQAEHRLSHSHFRYLFEDPLLATFSRHNDPREVVAHFRKAALYLGKRKIPRNELTDFLDFAQQLYAFIAAKVEFSSRIAHLLEEKNAMEQFRQQAAGLGLGAEKLATRYMELWRKRFRSEGHPDFVNGFSFLQERFGYLRQFASLPAARDTLLAELKNQSPLDSPGGVSAFRSFRS